jgi:hypothetical protein
MAVTGMDWLAANLIGLPTIFGKDAVTAKAAGTPHTPWYGTGLIGAGAAPSGGLNGAIFTGPAVAGQVGMPAAVAGKNSYLARFVAVHAGNIGLIQLIDRMWGDVPVVTTTTLQTITSPAWPARDTAGSTSGAGVFLAIECSSAAGNGAPITNTTATYTNSAGTGSRTATLTSFPATAPAGTFVPFSLQAGDVGVRSVQSVTLGTSYVSGQINLIAFRSICTLPTPNTNIANDRSWDDLGLPIIWDASVLQLVYWPVSTAVGAVSGDLTFAQG